MRGVLDIMLQVWRLGSPGVRGRGRRTRGAGLVSDCSSGVARLGLRSKRVITYTRGITLRLHGPFRSLFFIISALILSRVFFGISNFLRNAQGSARACVEFAARRVPSQATVSAPGVDVVRDVGDLQRTRQPPLPAYNTPPHTHTQTPLHNIIAVIIASENLANEDRRVVHCFTLTLEVFACQSLRVYRIHAD